MGSDLCGGTLRSKFAWTIEYSNSRRALELMSQMTHPATLSLIGYSRPSWERRSALIVMDFIPVDTFESLTKRIHSNTAPPKWNATAQSKAVLGITAAMTFIHSLDMLTQNAVSGGLTPEWIFIDEKYEVRLTVSLCSSKPLRHMTNWTIVHGRVTEQTRLMCFRTRCVYI
jgi:hypothetical protein